MSKALIPGVITVMLDATIASHIPTEESYLLTDDAVKLHGKCTV